MTTIISQKIIGQFVIDKSAPPPVSQETPTPTRTALPRPETLTGATYKLKTPLSEHALYITINDVEIDGKLRPFEIFINSKAMEHFQWVVAMTRVISAVFRMGGEVSFLIDELKSVHDPRGGSFSKGKYTPSLVSAIGDILETHLASLGLYARDDSLRSMAVAMLDEKLKGKTNDNHIGSILCNKCNEVSVVMLDGCMTCTSCGDSKCS